MTCLFYIWKGTWYIKVLIEWFTNIIYDAQDLYLVFNLFKDDLFSSQGSRGSITARFTLHYVEFAYIKYMSVIITAAVS